MSGQDGNPARGGGLRHLALFFELRTGKEGTTVRLHMRLPGATAAPR